jgi:hypothetical protein
LAFSRVVTMHQSEMERGSKFLMIEKQSSRMTDKETKIINKAQARKIKTNELGKISNPFSVFNNFHPSYFERVAQSCQK